MHAQIYVAGGGLTSTGTGTSTTVTLGGTLSANTAIDLGSSFKFSISKAAADFFNIQNDGKIGIGTSSPSTMLDVNGQSTFRNSLTLNFGTSNRTVQLNDQGLFMSRISDGSYQSSIHADGSMIFHTRNHHLFFTNSLERLRIFENGNVGIGTGSDDGFRLNVNGNTFTQQALIGGFAIARNQDAYMLGVANGMRVDGDYAGIRFQGSPQGHVIDNFAFESVYGNPRSIYQTNSSIMRIKMGWGDANTPGHDVATLRIDNEINNTNGYSYVVRGIYYDPVLTNAGAVTHIAFQNVSGTNHFNTTSGNTVISSTSDNGNKLQVTGNIWTTGFILPTGAAAGKVLTSDANGNATWQTASGGGSSGWAFGGNTVSTLKSLGTTDNLDLPIITNNTERMRIGANGNVGIGTSNPQAKLAVKGTVFAEKVKVTLAPTDWPDYVFDSTYRLAPLSEIEKFIRVNRHLPDVPSARVVAANGVDIGDNQAMLLKKIEELTLYIIDQDRKSSAQQKSIEKLEQQISVLTDLLKSLSADSETHKISK